MNFNQKCYNLLQKVPLGKITTYKLIAQKLNSKAYRKVGTAMKQNKNHITIPCHRVVNSSGKIGEFNLGKKKKIELLEKEGIKIKNEKIIDFDKHLYKFA